MITIAVASLYRDWPLIRSSQGRVPDAPSCTETRQGTVKYIFNTFDRSGYLNNHLPTTTSNNILLYQR